MDTLSKLFGGRGIVKILRVFLFNPEEVFEPKDVAKRTRTDQDIVRNELSMLSKIGFIKRKNFYKEVESKTTLRRKIKTKKIVKLKKKRVSGWTINQDFPYIDELGSLLISTAAIDVKNIVQRLKKAGNLKVVITSGVFMHDWNSRLDILIVGDNLKQGQLTSVIKEIESEVGREIRYAVLDTQDFKYRVRICDRLMRDVFDYPHEMVIDKIGVTMG